MTTGPDTSPRRSPARGRRLGVLVAADAAPIVSRVVGEVERRGHEATVISPLEAPRAVVDRRHDARVLTFDARARELIARDERPTLALVEPSGAAALDALRAGAAAVLPADATEVALERALAALLAPLEHQAAACECGKALDALLDALPVGVALVQDGALVSVNPALVDLAGASLQGQAASALVQGEDAAQLQRRVEAVAAWTGVMRLARAGLGPLDARLTVVPCARAGRPAAHLVVQEVSPEARASRELGELSAMLQGQREQVFLGSLVQSVVHDLRNPLQAALFGISTLRSGRTGGDAVGMIERKVREIDAILAELHDCAQPWRPARLPFPLRELLEGVRASLGEAAGERDVTVEVAAEAPAVDVDVDPPRLKQALLNVARLAVEAAPSQTVVRLGAGGGRGDPVWVEVHDERELPPLEAGPEAALVAGGARGSRRRMAITRRIVEAHGGTLRFDVHAPRGASVRIELPPT